MSSSAVHLIAIKMLTPVRPDAFPAFLLKPKTAGAPLQKMSQHSVQPINLQLKHLYIADFH